jgi:hypothetical protein
MAAPWGLRHADSGSALRGHVRLGSVFLFCAVPGEPGVLQDEDEGDRVG